jgi:ferredoxin-NADP reductase
MFEIIKNLPNLLQVENIAFIKKQHEAQNAYTFVFKKPSFGFKAGQHFIFVLKHDNPDNRKQMRIFSISSAPSDQYFTITARYFGKQSSSFKKAMFAMQAGDTISVRGPSPLQDHFQIKDYSQPYIYIVGGIGVTPLYSVLRDIFNSNKPLKAEIYYCNKNQDFIFGREIANIIKQLPDLKLHNIVSPQRITTTMLQKSLDNLGTSTTVIISGTEGFTQTYSDLAKAKLDLPKNQIKSYKYKPILGGGY